MGCMQFLPGREVDYSSLPAYKWSVSDVCTWLGQLGLNKHIDTFRTHQIDGKILLVLKKKNIREMGITDRMHMRSIRAGLHDIRDGKCKRVEVHPCRHSSPLQYTRDLFIHSQENHS